MGAKELKDKIVASGFDCAIAVATNAEVEAGAACGQMTLMNN